MLVGDVRWATTGSGSSWKLSGGRAWSSGPTKVSKNRQVRRATQRAGSARLRGGRGAVAVGAPGQADPPRQMSGASEPEQQRTARPPPGQAAGSPPAPPPRARPGAAPPTRHPPVEASDRGRARSCLRRPSPTRASSRADAQPHQRAHDRVGHQPGLVRQEGDHERDLGEGEARSVRRARRWLRLEMPLAAGTSREQPGGSRQAMVASTNASTRRRGGGQRPAGHEREPGRRPARARPAEVVEHLPAADRGDGRARRGRRRGGPRRGSTGSSCQSPRAQRCCRAAATS